MVTASFAGLGQSKRVLLVGVDPSLSDILVDDLADGSYPVDLASTAAQALDAVATCPYRVIVVDSRATNGDVSSFIAQCRAHSSGARLILLLPSLDPAILAQAFESGPFLCLKPSFPADELTQAVDLARET